MEKNQRVLMLEQLVKFLKGETRELYEGLTMHNGKGEDGSHTLFQIATPESTGLSSGHIADFYKALDEESSVRLHSAAIIRSGKLISYASWHPYSAFQPHMLYSASKSITAMAVMLAIAEGRFELDTKLVDMFPEYQTHKSGQHAKITVRHLLTMSAGVSFNETATPLEQDWVKAFFASEVLFRSGEKFFYNSLNSYILAAIIKCCTGQGLVDYLTPRLFEPLGIEGVRWESCPGGVEKGGWGLNLNVFQLARLGQLGLDYGAAVVDGREVQLIERELMELATTKQIETDSATYGYGFQMWMGSGAGDFQFNGSFGQYVCALRDEQLVVALTAGSEQVENMDASVRIVDEYFKGKCDFSQLEEDAESTARLSALTAELNAHKLPGCEVPLSISACSGRSYHIIGKTFGGLLPLVLQSVHGNYSRGLSAIKLEFTKSSATLTLTEGDDVNVVPVGLCGRALSAEAVFRDSRYRIGATGAFSVDDEGRDMLTVYISFLETPDMRILRIAFEGETLYIEFDERPSARAALRMLMDLVDADDRKTSDRMVINALRNEQLQHTVRGFLSPSAVGYMEDDARIV